LAGVDRLHVEPDDGGEHDQTAEQVVEQKLHCGVPALRAAVEPDEEVHRHQHRLEQDVEQQDVLGRERADDHCLQQQDESEERFGIAMLGLAPHRQQHDGRDDGCQQDERERDAIGAYGVEDPQRADPLVLFDELLGPTVGDERHRRDQGEDRRDHGDEQRELLRGHLETPRHQRSERGTEQRDGDQGGEPGERHGSLTTSMTTTTRAAPASIDRAYERTNPVCHRRNRLENRPTPDAVPITAPSMPRLST
jgi:hypothetical protein